MEQNVSVNNCSQAHLINHCIQWQSCQVSSKINKVASHHGETEQIWTYHVFFYQVLNKFSQVDDERFEDTLPSDISIGILQGQSKGLLCNVGDSRETLGLKGLIPSSTKQSVLVRFALVPD